MSRRNRLVPRFTAALVLAATGCAEGEEEFGDEDNVAEVDDDVEESHAGHDHVRVLDEDEALWDQAEFMAKEDGKDVGDVYDRLLYEQEVSAQLQDLVESGELGSEFAGGKFSDDDSLAVTWFFKGDVPQSVQDEVRLRDMHGITLQGGQPHSLTELIDMQDAVHVATVDLGYRHAYSAFDLESQEVTVEVADGPAFAGQGDQTRESVIAAAATDILGAEVRTADFKIVDVTGPRNEPTHGYGGSWMRLNDGTDWCTSGFVVRRTSDNVEGVLTASHCEGLRQIADHGDGFSFSAPWAGEHIGVWATSSGTPRPTTTSRSSTRATTPGRPSPDALRTARWRRT